MALTADKRDYRKGFNRNAAAYRKLADKESYTKRLLLFYSVECGLKYMLLDKWGYLSTTQASSRSLQEKLLKSHNLNSILKELGYQGMISFPVIKTVHGQEAGIAEYHQLCRYGIATDDLQYEKELELEKNLKETWKWLLERL